MFIFSLNYTSKFSKIYIIGSSCKDNVLDVDQVSKIINIYYLTNDTNEKNTYNMKSIKDAFKAQMKKEGEKLIMK